MKRIILFRISAVLLLSAVAAVMMVIGRGHTVYFDNKNLESGGQTYEAPYRLSVYVDGEEAAKLAKRERGMTICIGQTCNVYLEITDEKDGEMRSFPVAIPVPYNMDGVIINMPAYLAGLGPEVYLTEFVPTPEPEAPEDGTAPSEGEIPSDEEFLGDL